MTAFEQLLAFIFLFILTAILIIFFISNCIIYQRTKEMEREMEKEKKKKDLSELIKNLTNLVNHGDPENDHAEADDLLLNFIDNVSVTEAFNNIDKWYS